MGWDTGVDLDGIEFIDLDRVESRESRMGKRRRGGVIMDQLGYGFGIGIDLDEIDLDEIWM
jgi:hypothetical protein